MTDSHDLTLAALLREARDENRILRQRYDTLFAKFQTLEEEVNALRHKVWAYERAETDRLGTFPAPPRSKLGVRHG